MKGIFRIRKYLPIFISRQILLGFGVSFISAASLAGSIAQVPLFLVAPVKPNIMLMLDNSGSMNNIVAEAPYDPNTTYISNCPAANLVAPCDNWNCRVRLKISGNSPKIVDSTGAHADSSLTSAGGQICFATTGQYYSILVANGLNTGGAIYPGNFLNWYFNASNTTPAWTNQIQKPGTKLRMEIAKTAATRLVDSLNNVRLGLSAYYGPSNKVYADGGSLLEVVDDVDTITTKKAALKTKIDALDPENNTPLGETLSDIGRYFATGYSGDLTLHPGQGALEAKVSVANVFAQGAVSDHNLYNTTGSSPPSPIQYSCQKSFAILMTDGRPTQDRDISASLRDYTGDCAAGQCDSTPNNTSLPSGSLTVTTFQNGTKIGRTYEPMGSDYLDDVAAGLFDIDLRPDLAKIPDQKNNITTYTIGFADSSVANDPLLNDTAVKGGGLFIPAENSTQLADAFKNIANDIANQIELGSGSILAANSTRLDTSTLIYQAGFKSEGWTGFLSAFKLRTTSEVTDINSNGKLDLKGSVEDTELWEAGAKIPASGRNILSYNPAAIGTKGISFAWANLSSNQKTALDPIAAAASAASSDILDYIRGDQAKEKPNDDPTKVIMSGAFRVRATLLGDIINSDPFFVGKTENFGYALLPDAEGASYLAFRVSKKNRVSALYFGANDGMLHAINAGSGDELFTYIPDAVIPRLSILTDQKYGCHKAGCIPHEYFVDGSPRAGDAYFSDTPTSPKTWHTALLGTTGAGNGQAVFALDVTNPSATIGADKVLWEISPTQAPVMTDLNDVISPATPTKPGFANNLGYTIPQPTIVRMQDNSWVAIVPNGYNSVNKRAVLFILDLATGAIIRSFDTGAGSDTTPNGLSTPYPVDVDGDRITDYIYAGDLLGNMWKFDVTDPNPSNWNIPFGNATTPLPLFRACSDAACKSPQAITAKPQVGKNPEGGLMVYFGTGKYFESGDQIVGSPVQVHTFYAIRDNGTSVSGRSTLQKQSILAEVAEVNFDIRVTSQTAVDYAGNPTATPPVVAQNGWYMDLVVDGNAAAGERVVSSAKLRGDRIIFFTLIPSPETCKPGGKSWLMELEALTGKRLLAPPFDVDGNGTVTDTDKTKKFNANNTNNAITVSGRDFGDIVKDTTITSNGDGTEDKHTQTNTAKKEDTVEKEADQGGRQSWRQLR